MTVANIKKLPLSVVSAIVLASASLGAVSAASFACPYAASSAVCRAPYFKEFGADVMSGGWFVDYTNGTCSTLPASNYQDPGYLPAGSPASARGGILSYAKETANNSKGGASSQYAAFPLGDVGRNTTAGITEDFYTHGASAATTSTNVWKLTFANDNNGSSAGGKFEGTSRQNNCIPNYWGKKPTNNANIAPLGQNLAATPPSLSPGKAYAGAPASGNNFTLNTAPWLVPPSAQIVIYIDGDVYIGSNITYSAYTATTVPKFALVARGNIYIAPTVTQLDGLYIAQPKTPTSNTDVTDNDGDIWTCHPNNQADVYYTDPSVCNAKLTINGAVIAKQVNLLRTYGDVTNATNTEDKLSSALTSTNIGEIINYTPAMVLGGPFFNPPSTGALPIDSVVSLPPLF